MLTAVKDAPVVLTHRVAASELDAFGYVQPIEQARWCEAARLEYWRRLSSAGPLAREGVGTVLSHYQTTFQRAIGHPDTVSITARVARVGTHSLTYVLRIFSESQSAMAAEASSVVFLFDYDANMTLEISSPLRQAIERFEREGGHTPAVLTALPAGIRLESTSTATIQAEIEQLLKDLAQKDPVGLRQIAREDGFESTYIERLIRETREHQVATTHN